MFFALLLAANLALSASMDTSCLGTDADVNDETFLAEHVGNETLQAINDGERAFRYLYQQNITLRRGHYAPCLSSIVKLVELRLSAA